MTNEKPVRVIYEKSSKLVKFIWAVGSFLSIFGPGSFVVVFLLFCIQNDYGYMTPTFAFVYMVLYSLIGIGIIFGFVSVKIAQFIQWYDRGGIDE